MADKRIAQILILLSVSAGFAATAAAQTMRERGFEAVDQVVEDVDPLSRSLRDREEGLRQTGQFNTVYRSTNPDQRDRYFHVSQGVTAEYGGRSLYSLREDPRSRRRFVVQDIPPDTVFHIGMPQPEADPGESTQSFEPPPNFVDGRARLAERVEGRSDRTSQAQPRYEPTSPRAARAARSRADWQRFNEQALAQRRVVARLLEPSDQADDSPSAGPDNP